MTHGPWLIKHCHCVMNSPPSPSTKWDSTTIYTYSCASSLVHSPASLQRQLLTWILSLLFLSHSCLLYYICEYMITVSFVVIAFDFVKMVSYCTLSSGIGFLSMLLLIAVVLLSRISLWPQCYQYANRLFPVFFDFKQCFYEHFCIYTQVHMSKNSSWVHI